MAAWQASHVQRCPPPSTAPRPSQGSIEALGPWGAVAFVCTVVVAEMIPLFPTQPLSLAGGLLFGPLHGGLLVWGATCLAAVSAFTVSRTAGAGFAKHVVSSEMGSGRSPLDSLSGTSSSDSVAEGQQQAAPSNPLEAQLQRVGHAIEHGSFLQQYVAIVVLRMTPVVPFSAGNYLLGLSKLPYAPFMAGSATGMAAWSFFYASIGGASRSLLHGGANVEELFAEMTGKAAG